MGRGTGGNIGHMMSKAAQCFFLVWDSSLLLTLQSSLYNSMLLQNTYSAIHSRQCISDYNNPWHWMTFLISLLIYFFANLYLLYSLHLPGKGISLTALCSQLKSLNASLPVISSVVNVTIPPSLISPYNWILPLEMLNSILWQFIFLPGVCYLNEHSWSMYINSRARWFKAASSTYLSQ